MEKTYKWEINHCGSNTINTPEKNLIKGTIRKKSVHAVKLFLTKYIKEEFPDKSWQQWQSFENPSLYFRKSKDELIRIDFWRIKGAPE